jgi:hypothetical protein
MDNENENEVIEVKKYCILKAEERLHSMGQTYTANDLIETAKIIFAFFKYR